MLDHKNLCVHGERSLNMGIKYTKETPNQTPLIFRRTPNEILEGFPIINSILKFKKIQYKKRE